jgi:hypothetical protein
MMYEISYGVLAWGEVPGDLDHSAPDLFGILLKNPNTQFNYLIELHPFDTQVLNTLNSDAPYGTLAWGEFDLSYYGGINKVYLSNTGFVTDPSDTPSSQPFLGRVDNPLQYETSILSGDEFGNGNQSFGAVTIHNGDGKLDYLADYYWPSRRVVIKAGGKGFRYNDYAIVFDGAVNDFEASDDMITITIRDNRIKTDQLLMPAIYKGTGGLEGGNDLANTPKPLAYGVVKNIEPTLVDPVNLIYQFHDGSALAVDIVRDSGVMLTGMGDVPDITTAIVGAGQFKTQLSGGYIKLGSTPSGRITADVRGENTGGYVSTIGGIVSRVVTTRMGAYSLSNADIDGGEFNRLDDALQGDFGVYIKDRVSASGVIDELINPCGAYWTFTRQGTITAGVIDAPAQESYTITAGVIDENGIDFYDIPPAYRIKVGYAPVWTVQGEDELAGATTQADRAMLGAEYRYVTYENEVLIGQQQQAIEREFKTNLADKADAELLLARLVQVFSKKRRVYRVAIYRGMFRLDIGNVVKLVYNRYGLDAGKNFLVVGNSEDAETGQTILDLWG